MVCHKERSKKETTVIKFNLRILVFIFITLHLTLFIIVMPFSQNKKNYNRLQNRLYIHKSGRLREHILRALCG